MRLARAPLSVRLMLLSGAMTALVVSGAFWMVSVQARASARRISAQELTRSQRALVTLQHRSMEQLSLTASLITQRPNLGYTLSTYRLERNASGVHRHDLVTTVAAELDKLRAELGVDLIVATDEEGRVFAPASTRVAAVGAGLSLGTDLSTLPAVRRALDPSSTDGGLSVLSLGSAYYQVAVAPIVVNGFTLGTLIIGQRVDGQYLAALHDAFDGEVVVTAGERVIATTMRSAGAAVPTWLTDSGSASGTARTTAIGRDEFVVATLPLGETQTGVQVRLSLLQAMTPTIRALTSTMLPKFVTYGTVAAIVGMLGALLLARSALSPLAAFVSYMRDGANAERLASPFDASAAALEIRALNSSFEQLMASLEQKRGQLQQRTDELSTANVVLTGEMRERERVEHALRESEAQLRQSQKMEAIGTLAGGIAHDFNNLLTVMSGFTQLALMHVEPDHPVASELRQVLEAGSRAARLTQQLLTFSRKQVMQPCVLDAQSVIDGMEGMLRRLAGEQIDLRIERPNAAARIKADPSQLEQVILNLVVNARDAMPNGGSVTIATTLENGRVSIAVTDSGVGMTDAIRERVFEPFFTTKEPGKGTGLGLSTVYGIVKQSGGTIEVASTLGKGTTFTVVLPEVAEAIEGARASEDGELPRGSEIVLLVEDENDVRSFARRTLEECGYTVLEAVGGVEALALMGSAESRVDVLLTDIVMPRMNGPQLVEQFIASYPAPVIVYMSGYAEDAVMRLDIDPGTAFLRKPFTPYALARTIRDALDATRRAPHVLSNN